MIWRDSTRDGMYINNSDLTVGLPQMVSLDKSSESSQYVEDTECIAAEGRWMFSRFEWNEHFGLSLAVCHGG